VAKSKRARGGKQASKNRVKRRQHLAAELADATMEFDQALNLSDTQKKWLEGYLRWGNPVEASRYAGTSVNLYSQWSIGGNEDFLTAKGQVEKIHDDLVESRMMFWAMRGAGPARFMLRAHRPETYSRRSLEPSTGAGERHVRTIEINVSGNLNIVRMGGAGPLDHLLGGHALPEPPKAAEQDAIDSALQAAEQSLNGRHTHKE
jgi:hypothetical protein